MIQSIISAHLLLIPVFVTPADAPVIDIVSFVSPVALSMAARPPSFASACT